MTSKLTVGARKVLVTGGGSGIGRAVAQALLEDGAQVVVTGRRAEALAAIAGAIPLSCDVTDPAARQGLLARAKELLGGLDGFVHCAGAVVHQPFGHIDEASLRRQLEVNLVAPLRLGEEALEVLEPGGGMVFVASTLALRPLPTSAVYSAAKAGLIAAMKALAISGAPRRVRANAVLPGIVDTDMVRTVRLAPGEAMPEGEALRTRLDAQMAKLSALHPLGRMGEVGEVAAAIIHLLQAPWTTGAELVVDGGLLLRE